MTMKFKRLSLGILVLASLYSLSLAAQQNASPVSKSRKNSGVVHSSRPQDDGERVFQQNCARCHTAPDGFSPRISGTVVRHMRFVASLTQRQEEALLRFFNP
jgi:cytochrome c5